MKKSIFIFLLAFTSISCFAIVPTMDVGPAGTRAAAQTAQDGATMGSYVATVTTTMGKISSTMSAVKQLQNLQGLQKLQAAKTLCTLCSQTDSAQLQSYQSSIDEDLCSQFSNAYQNLTGVMNAASSLKDIMGLLQTNPQAAMMSLQQATISAQQTTNSTLAQMQLLQAQSMQKQLAQEKNQRQTAQAIATGMQNGPGL